MVTVNLIFRSRNVQFKVATLPPPKKKTKLVLAFETHCFHSLWPGFCVCKNFLSLLYPSLLSRATQTMHKEDTYFFCKMCANLLLVVQKLVAAAHTHGDTNFDLSSVLF